MLPSALPAVVPFDRGRRARVPIVSGLVFAARYLAVWTLFGAIAFFAYRALLTAHPGLAASAPTAPLMPVGEVLVDPHTRASASLLFTVAERASLRPRHDVVDHDEVRG